MPHFVKALPENRIIIKIKFSYKSISELFFEGNHKFFNDCQNYHITIT